MNVIEAIKTKRCFRRFEWPGYMHFDGEALVWVIDGARGILELEDYLADDYEIEEKRVEVTRALLTGIWGEIFSYPGKKFYLEDLCKKLGL